MNRGTTTFLYIYHYQKHLGQIELILSWLRRTKSMVKTFKTVCSQAAEKLKNIITKPWVAEAMKLSILWSTHMNFRMSNKLNACYISSLSGGINLISLISLVTISLEVCNNFITLKFLLFHLYCLKLIPGGKKLFQGNERSYQSDSIIFILALSP